MTERYFYEHHHIFEKTPILDEDGEDTKVEGEMLKEGYLVFDGKIGRGTNQDSEEYVAFCLQRADAERITSLLNATETRPVVLVEDMFG